MKNLLVLIVLCFLVFGCKIQSMYESEPDDSFYSEDPGMIYYDYYRNYDYYGYYHPYYQPYYIDNQNGVGINFTHKDRKHPDVKPDYKPKEVKPYRHGTPIQKPNEGNKQWGDRIIKQQNQNNFHQSPQQNNYQHYSSPSRQVTHPQQNTQQTPSNSTRQGRPVEK